MARVRRVQTLKASTKRALRCQLNARDQLNARTTTALVSAWASTCCMLKECAQPTAVTRRRGRAPPRLLPKRWTHGVCDTGRRTSWIWAGRTTRTQIVRTPAMRAPVHAEQGAGRNAEGSDAPGHAASRNSTHTDTPPCLSTPPGKGLRSCRALDQPRPISPCQRYRQSLRRRCACLCLCPSQCQCQCPCRLCACQCPCQCQCRMCACQSQHLCRRCACQCMCQCYRQGLRRQCACLCMCQCPRQC